MSIRHDEDQSEPLALGSSVYGGRPTFALIRNEDEDDVKLTLYELLPIEQADARRRRIERQSKQASKVDLFTEVIGQDIKGCQEWNWDNWAAVKVQKLSGSRLRSILPLMDDTLRESSIDPTTITGTGGSEVLISEGIGVRLSLAFIGIKPLQRVDRMRAFSRGISNMSLEECYYWYAKCRSPNSPNGAKALRTLLRG